MITNFSHSRRSFFYHSSMFLFARSASEILCQLRKHLTGRRRKTRSKFPREFECDLFRWELARSMSCRSSHRRFSTLCFSRSFMSREEMIYRARRRRRVVVEIDADERSRGPSETFAAASRNDSKIWERENREKFVESEKKSWERNSSVDLLSAFVSRLEKTESSN